MKKLFFLLLFCFPLILSAESKITVINLRLTEAELSYLEESGRKPRITSYATGFINPEFTEAQQDQEGNWCFLIPNPQTQYATLTIWGNGDAPIFITAGMELDVYVIPDKGFRYEGDGANINNYLNTAPINGVSSDEIQLNEEEFIAANEKACKTACQKLKEAKLPKEFSQLEEQRLQFLFANKPSMYITVKQKINSNYTPSQHLKEYASALFNEKDNLILLTEYKQMANTVIDFNWQPPTNAKNREDETLSKINFILERFKGEKLREYLIGSTVYFHILHAGLQDTARIEPLFRKYVKDPKIIKEHNKLCAELTSKTDKILSQTNNQRKKCPAFKFKDINGKDIALEDFKGKYVYIDCWATWCGPCKRELPYLKKLEEKYKDRNIAFVSISSDKDVEAWKKMVNMDKLGGIQLNIGTDRSFHNALKINTIPRFLLVDPEGYFVSDDAPRPSNSQIEILFDSLKGL